MNRRMFIAGAGMALAALAVPIVAQSPMTEAEALLEARRRWGASAFVVNAKPSFADPAGLLPNIVGWYEEDKSNSRRSRPFVSYFGGQTWEEAFWYADQKEKVSTYARY